MMAEEIGFLLLHEAIKPSKIPMKDIVTTEQPKLREQKFCTTKETMFPNGNK